jgi:hypothetical protein
VGTRSCDATSGLDIVTCSQHGSVAKFSTMCMTGKDKFTCYTCPVWRSTVLSHIRKLQVLQCKCLCIATSAPWYIGNKHIHNDLGVMNGDESDQNDQTIGMLKTIDSCLFVKHYRATYFFNEHANIFSVVFCHVFLCRQYPQRRKRGHSHWQREGTKLFSPSQCPGSRKCASIVSII